jgi:hypothetical protein
MFTCIDKYEAAWKGINGLYETERLGEEKHNDSPQPVEVSLSSTVNAFKFNYDNFAPIYKSVLSKDIQTKFEQLKALETTNVELSSDIWAKTVYSFITEFRKEQKEPRSALLLIDALRILWIGRVAAFMKDTWNLELEQAEEKIREETKIFAKLKPYLVDKY